MLIEHGVDPNQTIYQRDLVDHINNLKFLKKVNNLSSTHRKSLMKTNMKKVNSFPITIAAQLQHHEVLRSLLTVGADYNNTDGNGNTALSWAIQKNDKVGQKILIDAGAKY